MNSNMPMINIKLPEHCRRIKRKGYDDIYFAPNKRHIAKGWKPTTFIGRLTVNNLQEILDKCERTLLDYNIHRSGVDLYEDKQGSIPDLIKKYKVSEYWETKAPRNQYEYSRYFGHINDWSDKNNHPHVSLLTAKAIVTYLKQYKDKPRTRKMYLYAFKELLKIAIDEGEITHNIAYEIKLPRSNKPKRKKVLWEEEAVDIAAKACDDQGYPSLGSIIMTMIETTQRLGDVTRMVNGRDWVNGELKYIQQKTGSAVFMPPTQKLKDRYKKFPPSDYMMFINEDTNRPWLVNTITHKIRKILDSANMEGYILRDLRPSQVTYLFSLGCTPNQIASFTGHTLGTVTEMMDSHYAETRQRELAKEVVTKIDEHRANKKRLTEG